MNQAGPTDGDLLQKASITKTGQGTDVFLLKETKPWFIIETPEKNP